MKPLAAELGAPTALSELKPRISQKIIKQIEKKNVIHYI
jgi:hypothetical protein